MAYDFEEADGDRIDNITSHADYTTTVSCSFWVKAESNPGSHQAIFVSKGKDGANEPNIRFLWTPAGGGDVYTAVYAGGGFNEWKADYSPTTGAWEHWYFEIDWTTNPDTHLFWVNGVAKTMTHNFGSNNITPSTTATQTITLGGSDTGDANNADALISDVAFWTDIVGETRAQGLYNAGNGGLAAALYPTNLVEDIPLRVDPDNRKGGAGSLVNTPVLSTDNPFTATILRASASNSASTGTAVSVSAPTGTTTGDVVVVSLHGNGQTTFVDNNTTIPTPVNLTAGTKTVDATSATTASISVTLGRLYLLSVASKTEITADPNQPTATGTGLSFAVPANGTVVYDNSSSSRRRVTFLWAVATATGSTTVVIDFGGQTQVTSIWSIEEIAYGFDTVAPIVQAAQNSSPSSAVTSITATLSAFGASGNATFGCGAIGNGTDTITAGTSFTQLTQTKDATENNLNLITEYRLANDTTVDMSFTSQAEVGIIGVEIKASTSTFTASSVSDYKPNTTGGHTVSIYSRTIQSGDPSTYNFTMGATGRWSIIADTYKSPNTTSFFDVAPSTSNAANADNSDAATIDAPTITTLTAKAIHVVHGYFDDGAAGNPSGPSGYYAAGADNDEPQVAVLKHITTASATGAQTVTGTSVAPRIALSYAIRDINSVVASVLAKAIFMTTNTSFWGS